MYNNYITICLQLLYEMFIKRVIYYNSCIGFLMPKPISLRRKNSCKTAYNIEEILKAFYLFSL